MHATRNELHALGRGERTPHAARVPAPGAWPDGAVRRWPAQDAADVPLGGTTLTAAELLEPAHASSHLPQSHTLRTRRARCGAPPCPGPRGRTGCECRGEDLGKRPNKKKIKIKNIADLALTI